MVNKALMLIYNNNNMENNLAIYTAIFGEREKLYPQNFIKGVDFICFSDRPHKTKGWKVIVVEDKFKKDHVRNNRYCKMLPHLYLPEYEYSIYIDGNFVVINSPLSIINTMGNVNMLVFDHNKTKTDARNCIYKEFEAIVKLYQQKGVLKDEISLMKSQIDFIKSKGYPENNGLIKGGVLIRKHNEPDVIAAMERWWYFIENFSKRDQLSFNYVAWECNFKFDMLPGDIRKANPWFYMINRSNKNYKFSVFKEKIRKFLRRLHLKK